MAPAPRCQPCRTGAGHARAVITALLLSSALAPLWASAPAAASGPASPPRPATPTHSTAPSDYARFEAQGAQALLAESDRRANHYDTQRWRMKMVIRPPGGDAKTLIFRVWQKDQSKRLVRFDEPGDVKGLSMLSASKTVMYVYSPDTDNARRIGTSARRQTLIGSNLNYDDMASVDLSDDYDAAFDGPADDGRRWLRLTKKPGAKTTWDTLRVAISERTVMAEIIEYREDGRLVRVQTRSGFELLDGVPTYRKVEMKSLDSGLITELEVLEQTIGLDLPDKMFKKRYLIRGR